LRQERVLLGIFTDAVRLTLTRVFHPAAAAVAAEIGSSFQGLLPIPEQCRAAS
jgi:hypothetical protein